MALVVAALIGLIALPDRSGPSPAAVRLSQSKAAVEALNDFRAAIEAYRIDHGVWPGWEGTDGSGAGEACLEVFVDQLTQFSDKAGNLAREPGGEHPYGPCLPAGLPANPISGLTSVRVLGREQPWPLTADDRTGWIYDPRSGMVKLNSQGRLEGSDVRYFDR